MTQEERMARFADKKTFQDWDPGDLWAAFGVKEILSHPILTEWVAAVHPVPPHKVADVERLALLMKIKRSAWNETELRNGFISPLLAMISFEGEGFSTFSERTLTAKVDGITLTGTVDWMVASGNYRPEKPIFFLHEYKRFKAGEADPFGQLVASMLAAQALNDSQEPMFGAVVVANIWYFVVLDGREFALSASFDAADPEELPRIWSVLMEMKLRIEKQLQTA